MKTYGKILKSAALILVIAAMTVLLSACGGTANADDASGTHGALNWSYTKEDKTLTVTGAGAMTSFEHAEGVAWESVKTSAEKLVVGEGITSVGNYAFYYMPALTSVTLPSTLTAIGDMAFAYSSALSEITIPEGVTALGKGAFEGCGALKTVLLPSSVTFVGDRAFAYCYSLTGAILTAESVSVGAEAFRNCRALETLMFRSTMTADKIAASAFDGASKNFDSAVLTDHPTGATTVTVRYMLDGAELEAERRVETYDYGKSYSIPSPTREGYTADMLDVTGTANGQAREVVVTYQKNEAVTEVQEETPEEVPEEEQDEPTSTSLIISLVIMGVVLLAIAVGAFLLMRFNKKTEGKNTTTVRKNPKSNQGTEKKNKK